MFIKYVFQLLPKYNNQQLFLHQKHALSDKTKSNDTISYSYSFLHGNLYTRWMWLYCMCSCTSTLDSLDLFLKQPSTQLIDNCLCGLVPFLREISIQGVGGATGCEVKQSDVKLAVDSMKNILCILKTA